MGILSTSRPFDNNGRQDWRAIKAEIVSRLGPSGVIREYEACGVKFVNRTPNAAGFVGCRAPFRNDGKRPAGRINVYTGLYMDMGGNKEKLSLFDFAVRARRYLDFWDALRSIGRQVDVEIPEYGGQHRPASLPLPRPATPRPATPIPAPHPGR